MKENFYSLKRKELRLLAGEALSLLDGASTFKNKDGYVVLKFSQNLELKEALDKLGFFDFHCTNNGHVAGVHQIVLYLHRGIFILRYYSSKVANKDQEIHHLNSVRDDNRPENLTYVTPQQNSLCANAVNQLYPGKLKKKHIKSWAAFGGGLTDTAKLVRLTLVRTIQAGGFSLNQVPTIANILMQLPANLGKKLVKIWQFGWQTQQV